MAIDAAWLQTQFPGLTQIEALGGGGEKYVFSARHPADGDVVLKLVKPMRDQESIRREILVTQQIDCPRIPRILETGVLATPLGQLVWFREQRVMGEPLRTRLGRGVLPTTDILRLALHVLEGLVAAEQKKIVHRDVKPDNIIAATGGGYSLIDFGVARHLTLPTITDAASLFGKGTFGYSAPEQMRNVKREIDGRSDLFALSVTLCECATGVNPFTNGARDHMDRLVRSETIALPLVVLPIPQPHANGFQDLTTAMGQKRRDQRPRTVAEALDWIRPICTALGVS